MSLYYTDPAVTLYNSNCRSMTELANELSPDQLREYIKQGYCWICHKHGWRRLAQHTAMAHQIFANDIRVMAILCKRTPTCIQEESEVLSARRLRLLKQGKVKIPDWRLRQFGKVEYSQAGLASLRNNCEYMRSRITEEQKKKAVEAAIKRTIKPHPCPVCGRIVAHAKPICCSPQCRKERLKIGLDVGRELYITSPIHRERMMAILDRAREKPKAHLCPKCGELVIKSRPKYCSRCSNRFNTLPRVLIAERYISGESRNNLAKEYGISLTLVSLIKKNYLRSIVN